MRKLGMFLRLINKAVSQRPDELQRGIDRAARTADRKTGGRYRSKIERGTSAATRYIDRHGRGRSHPS